MTSKHILGLEEAKSYEILDDGVILKCKAGGIEGAKVRLKVVSPGIIRFTLFPIDEDWGESDSLVAINESELKAAPVIRESSEKLEIETEDMKVEIELDPFKVRYLDGERNLLTEEVQDDRDIAGRYLGYPVGFTAKKPKKTRSKDPLEYVEKSQESLLLRPEEHIYGFGEKFTAFDKVGQEINIWNRDALGTRTEKSYKNIPFFLSSEGYGILVKNSTNVTFNMGNLSNRTYTIEVPENRLDYYVIYGPTPKDIIQNYTDLTGKPPVPPRWSFGLWISTYFTEASEESVMEQVKKMEEYDIPFDVYHFDCYWLRDERWCDFTWDRDRFPDPEGLIDELHNRGKKVCLWENPYVSIFSEMFEEGKEKKYFVTHKDGSVFKGEEWGETHPATAIVDFTNEKAKKWYIKKHKKLTDMGVDTFKTDFGEEIPEEAHFKNGKTGREMRNLYPLLYNQTVFETVEEETGNSLVWARSAHAGSQRYPTHWSGDPHCTWEDMASVLRGGLSFMMSGMSFWSHDIGGFIGEPSPELFARWSQFGFLSPHSRLHGASNHDPWKFGEEAREIFKKYAKLRYQLIPYLYSYANLASEKGIPMMRPMFMEFPMDPATYTLSGQYMLGRELLVAPVLREDGKKEIYLPEGKWMNFWTGKEIEGRKFLKRNVPLEELPMYVREDSIIPLGPVMDHVDEKEEKLTLLINLQDSAEFTCHTKEDKIKFECERTEDGLRFEADKSGTYTVKIKDRKKEIQVTAGEEKETIKL